MSDRVSIGDIEDRRKQKRKMEEPSPIGSTGTDEDQLMVITTTPKSLKISEDSGSSPPVEVKEYYPCHYCEKKFRSSQALGGHQNAHKHQRALHQLLGKEVKNNTFGTYASSNNASTISSYNPFPYSISTFMPNLGPFFQGSSSPPSLYHGGGKNLHSHLHPPNPIANNNIVSSWPQLGIRVPNTTPQFGINNYWGRTAIPHIISNPMDHLGLSAQTRHQTPNSLAASPFLANPSSHSDHHAPPIGVVGGIQENNSNDPNGSPKNSTSEELDLTLRL